MLKRGVGTIGDERMIVLVVNIGSTSFKFRLLDMETERELARGGVEGVGTREARVTLTIDAAPSSDKRRPVRDQGEAIEICLAALHAVGLRERVDAVGFKAVHGGRIAQAARVTPEVIETMRAFADAAPAHNPAYIAAMEAFAAQTPDTPLVAAFETAFHQTIPEARRTYATPYAWKKDFGVQRYGFHGASHKYVATRTAELLQRDDLRVISCHLGGSSSICAIRDGRSIANSFGMTPQSGLPQNNRVGDFDTYALLPLRARSGKDFDTLLNEMAREGGLLGISGLSNDMQQIIAAAHAGDARAQLAIDVYTESVRDYIGAYWVALGGLDVLAFTGGVGQRSAEIRGRVCRGLEFAGVELDAGLNEQGGGEVVISKPNAPVTILALQTNEELIVARQTAAVLAQK